MWPGARGEDAVNPLQRSGRSQNTELLIKTPLIYHCPGKESRLLNMYFYRECMHVYVSIYIIFRFLKNDCSFPLNLIHSRSGKIIHKRAGGADSC